MPVTTPDIEQTQRKKKSCANKFSDSCCHKTIILFFRAVTYLPKKYLEYAEAEVAALTPGHLSARDKSRKLKHS